MLVIILFSDPGEFDDTPTVNLEFSNSSHITVSLHQWMNNMTGDVPPTRLGRGRFFRMWVHPSVLKSTDNMALISSFLMSDSVPEFMLWLTIAKTGRQGKTTQD